MNERLQPARRFYWEPEDRRFIVDASHKHWPEEVKQVVHRADLACQNTFIFTHRWDMERCEEEVSFPEGINWYYRHNEDLEWLVMLNRSRYMGELGQAYWLTGKEKYAEGFIRLLKDWIRQNPLTEEEVLAAADRNFNVKDTWRKLDSGIRITHWLKGYYCVRSCALWGAAEEELFMEGVRRHGMYLNLAYVPHDRQSNWGFLETNGLFQLALMFPELEEAEVWQNTALQRLSNMCKLQVFQDGLQNEQCTMYHHEVLHCLFESLWLGKLNGIEMPEVLHDTLNRMFSASLAFVQPDGRQPMLGDSDSTDIRDVLCRGAVLFSRGDLKRMAYDRLDYEGIWFFGERGYDRFRRLVVQEPEFTSILLKDSGYAFMRSDWSSKGQYLVFDGGHMDVIRAHGHDDLLHVSLFAHGREFLIDPGRYTYMETEDRQYFMESLQHNTLSVDGETISTYVSSWRWTDVARPIDRYWSSGLDYDYVQAGHDGYWRLDQPVHVFRQVLFVKPDYWIMIDTCRSHGEHEYTIPFHFAEGIQLTIREDGIILADSGEDEPGLSIIPLTPVRAEQGTSWVSRNYNEKTPAVKASFRQKGKGFTKFVTLLYPNPNGEVKLPVVQELEVLDSYGHQVPSDLATAFSIQRENGKEEFLFSHQGPRSYRFGDHHLSGDALLVRTNGLSGHEIKSYVIKV
ncbi:alginate lyase family protein [Paenibacillus lentus]|uniref:Alginate lyase family protein n=1 Tax=Paenibacillus lentus TaxID=1338368 RepID=A0A3S8RXR7_9BACL|nr:alginate lyase family protein [Paenibacillus lentus]AZK47670.1 alginate lyase family protein [Paenibacillus lentus]